MKNFARPLRLAVIGLNHGIVHAKNIASLDKSCLAAVCATGSNAARRDWASRMEVPFFSSYETMIRDVPLDGVVISTPNCTHAEIAGFCAARGLNLLIEKPIAHTLEESNKILTCVRRFGVKALVGQHRRFSPQVRRLKQLLQSGTIGDVVGANVVWALRKNSSYYENVNGSNWKVKRSDGGGVLLINVVHEIDTLRFLFGEIVEVTALGSKNHRHLEVEDTVIIAIRFAGGQLASLFVSDCAASQYSYEHTVAENPAFPKFSGSCALFFGSTGTLTFPDFQLHQAPRGGAWMTDMPTRYLGPTESTRDPLLAEMEHFCDVIQGVVEPVTTVADAHESLKATLAVARILSEREEENESAYLQH
jgi:predicted dehydrogenase